MSSKLAANMMAWVAVVPPSIGGFAAGPCAGALHRPMGTEKPEVGFKRCAWSSLSTRGKATRDKIATYILLPEPKLASPSQILRRSIRAKPLDTNSTLNFFSPRAYTTWKIISCAFDSLRPTTLGALVVETKNRGSGRLLNRRQLRQ